MDLWYKPHKIPKLPEASISINILSPASQLNLFNNTIFELFTEILKSQLINEITDANTAGLNIKLFENTHYNMFIDIQGFNDIMNLAIDVITQKLGNFLKDVTPEMLETFKDKNKNNYYEKSLDVFNLNL